VSLVLDLRIDHERWGVQLAQSNRDQFHYRRTAVSSHLKSKVGNILKPLVYYPRLYL
jgi:hypothetical protein